MAESLSAAVVNEALQFVGGNQKLVTGASPAFDNSDAGIAASQLYVPTVQAVARRFGWDFSRNIAALQLTGNTPADPNWALEYLYPSNGIQIRQLIPSALPDANDPLPINWSVGNTTVSGAATKVIWTNLAGAIGVITNQPPENLWDAGFREAVVRLLGSALAMGIGGRPDTAREMVDEFGAFETVAQERMN